MAALLAEPDVEDALFGALLPRRDVGALRGGPLHLAGEGLTLSVAQDVGHGEKVVVTAATRGLREHKAYDVPPLGCGEPFGVLGAQVVGVWFGERGERTEHRLLVGVDVGEGRDGPASTRGSRAAAHESHTLDDTAAAPGPSPGHAVQ